MIYVLDSMIAVIEPEMPRQIATWGGTYAAWQNNVTDLRNFILARCDSMNSGLLIVILQLQALMMLRLKLLVLER